MRLYCRMVINNNITRVLYKKVVSCKMEFIIDLLQKFIKEEKVSKSLQYKKEHS